MKLTCELVKDLCETCYDETHYCTLKEIMLLVPLFDVRFIVQLKCIEMYKYEAGERFNTDIGWEEAIKEWGEIGYANLFGVVYDELSKTDKVIHPRKVYNLIKQNSQNLEEHI